MKPTIFLIALLLILACLVIPAHAVVYSEEYQNVIVEQQQLFGTSNFYKPWDAYGGCASGRAANIIYLELRRQTILMEKQNELLEEQNGLLRNLTNQTR